jgi:hypothetical protein
MGLVKFLENHTGVNIILLNAPLRYDLVTKSCVNKEIVKFNRQIKKILKLYPNVRGLEIDLQRQFFTQHGQHLNNNGKERIASKLAKIILQYFEKTAMDSIQLSWNEDNSQKKNLVGSNKINDIEGANKYESPISSKNGKCNEVLENCRRSVRTRKQSSIKSRDFLW